ncbi:MULTISPECIES: SDR family oxidoreductase [unclassified Corallococcus]|uniref:SDR family oxidoreductase n=1 Tax=unclassified Corallococcus TaxID=2685029 RepID=UPI001A8E0469|nr:MULTISPECIES: SDR family oxidoreductase [unclassified Corallococcus]MBN9688204.1 SDR family oxidoreductase [Corallococcus sp. NCSPR001]WAS87990.1 SDR family oxidoreductase [Corallococcus sp. NCRR]
MARNPDPRDAGPKPPFPEQTQPSPGHEGRMEPEPDYGEQSYKGFGRLQDRVALVTGGDSGIGRAVCLAFAREGADVAFAYLSEGDDANHTRRVIEGSGRQALALAGDMALEATCKRIVEDTVKKFGRIDVLVNNAAYQGKAVEKFEELEAERVERAFKVNILAMFHLVKYALPHMKPGATIINTASIQAYQPTPSILDYATTKGAIVTFTKGLSQELIGRGIRVNAVAPGPVWTPLIPQSYDGEKVKEFGKSSPTGRPAQPAELAPSYVFLACDESRFVNGDILGVTGGMLLA